MKILGISLALVILLGLGFFESFATTVNPPEDSQTIELREELDRISLDGVSKNFILSNLRTLDRFDNVLDHVVKDQTVNTMVDLKNISNTTQDFSLVIATNNKKYMFPYEWVKVSLEPQKTFVYNHTWTLDDSLVVSVVDGSLVYTVNITFAVSTDPIKKDLESGLELFLIPKTTNSYLIIDKKIPYTSLKKQLQEKVEFDELQCNNPDHVLVERTNEKLACVTEKAAERFGWEIPKPTPFTIQGIPEIIHRGDFLEIFGTGNPNSAITAEVVNSEGEIINSRTAEIDSKGNWKLEEPIIVAADTPFGEYSATITDGREEIVKHWTVESDKIIIITPISLKFELGEVMKFNGTALPNKPIEMILENPFGKEVFSDIIQVDDSGFVEFEFQTDQNTAKGTYTLIVTQEKEKDFIFVGLGQLPSIPVNFEFENTCHYSCDDRDPVVVQISGERSAILSLQVRDSSEQLIFVDDNIMLKTDGRLSYNLDIANYSSGVYSLTVNFENSTSTDIFAIGISKN